jgi:hypothetical protein
MKTRREKAIIGAVSLALGLGALGGYSIERVRAAGGPAMQAMSYSGVLTDATGKPMTGMPNIQIQIMDMATGGNTLCTVGPTPVTLSNGSFQMSLPNTCTTAIHANPDAWIEVFANGTSLGRSKLGAVPYALEADHAVAATTATNATHAAGADTATAATNATHATSADNATTAASTASVGTAIQMNSSGFVNCQPLVNFRAAGYTNVLVRAALYSDAGCTAPVDQNPDACHQWCAGAYLRSGTPAAGCCGVGVYYTAGVVDVLQYK